MAGCWLAAGGPGWVLAGWCWQAGGGRGPVGLRLVLGCLGELGWGLAWQLAPGASGRQGDIHRLSPLPPMTGCF